MQKVVSSISVLESTDPSVLISEVFPRDKYSGSEIVITGFLNCINDVDRQCSNLMRLIDGGEVGLVLYYVGVYLPRVDRRLIDIADAHDFVLICMPEGQRHLRYSDLITDVTECIYRDRSAAGSLVSDILARISSAPHRQQSVGTALQMLCTELDTKGLYQKAVPYLIQPVRTTVFIEKSAVTRDMFPAGLSALSEMSMLNPPAVETWGTVGGKIKGSAQKLIDSEKQCALQLWRYDPRRISQTGGVDVLSLAASLADDMDERVEQCIEEILEKVW